MRVAEAGVTRHTLTYRCPITTTHGLITERRVLLLTLTDEDGHTGVGEAAPLDGFTPEGIDEAEVALLAWAAEDGDESLVDSPTARAAVDAALHDLAAAAAGVALHQYLNPDSPASLPVAALVVGDTPDLLAEAALAATTGGHRSLKLKVGALPISDDLERVAAVRRAIGPEPAIRLDANGAWSPEEAPGHLERLAGSDIQFIEEPVSGIPALANIMHVSPIPVAADESVRTPFDLDRLIATGAADLVVLKPSAIGGISVAAKWAARARSGGMAVVVTSLLESSVGIRAAAHLASAIDALDPAPGLATAGLLATDLGTPLLPEAGFLRLA
ncbi:MAG: o-succinylbenzoate synthase [Acidimicrobiales bacterium]|nr:o-succinylbenzoate synthase [Acidimicrobiales bacterium]